MSVIELPPDDLLSSVVWEVCRNHGAKNSADHVQRAGDGYSENLHVIPGQFFVLLMSEADRINYETGGKNMEKWLYVMMIKRGKSYNRVTKAVITKACRKSEKFGCRRKDRTVRSAERLSRRSRYGYFQNSEPGRGRSPVQAGAACCRRICNLYPCGFAGGGQRE